MASQNDDRNRPQPGSEAASPTSARQLVQVIPSARSANTPALIEADLYEEFELPAVLRPPQQQPQQLRERLRLVETSRPAAPKQVAAAPLIPAEPVPVPAVPQTSPPTPTSTPAEPPALATVPAAFSATAEPAPTGTNAQQQTVAPPPAPSVTNVAKVERPAMPFMDTRMRRMAESIYRPAEPLEPPALPEPQKLTTPVEENATASTEAALGAPNAQLATQTPHDSAPASPSADDPFSALPVLDAGVASAGVVLPPPLPAASSVIASADFAVAGASAALPAPIGADNTTPVPIDAAAADLLRPMLQDWLSENLPRIVEKALRIEMTGAPTQPTAADAADAKPSERKPSQGANNAS